MIRRGANYEDVFEYFFDCLDPNTFVVDRLASAAIIERINEKLKLKITRDLNEFDIKNGLKLNGSHIFLDKTFTHHDDFTMFLVFKHDTSITQNNVFGFGSINGTKIYQIPPFDKITADKFIVQKTHNTSALDTILEAYKNKQLMLWYTKEGSIHQLNLCDNGGLIITTISAPNAFQSNKVFTNFGYYIQRVGFSPECHAVNGPEFHKILFLEKSRGTFFQ